MTPIWRRRPKGGSVLCAILLVAALAGCKTFENHAEAVGNPGPPFLRSYIPEKKVVSEAQQIAAEGVRLIDEGEFEEASIRFNLALKLDLTNSYLQFFNGLAYHLRALKNDTSQFALGEQGYAMAVQFDPTNWIAHYYRGLLHLDQRQHAKAQQHFAEALIYRPDEPDLLYNMAVASYYAHDPETAAAALRKLRDQAPEDARVMRASSVVMAALGQPTQANQFLGRYAALAGDDHQIARLSSRLKDWRSFHSRNHEIIQAQYSTTQVETQELEEPEAEEEEEEEEEEEAEPDEHQMVIVDVVIIRTEEDLSTSKGVNLLSGLTIQFGASNADTAALAYKKFTTTTDTSSTTDPYRTLTRSITIPAITYSLNIANAAAERNEILARPTLIGLAGQEAEFFSGVNLKAAANVSGEGAQPPEVDQDIGVKLNVTPEFLEDGRIQLTVSAERTFLKTPSTSVNYTYKVETSKTAVTASVAMNFGETLILSGMSEKEREFTSDGVPLLQDLPGIQYFFSKRTTRDFQKSVLVLLTPRRPQYVYQKERLVAGGGKGQAGNRPVLNELQARYNDWFKPYPNWASVFRHMQDNALYREFRTGDVTLEKWETQGTRTNRLKQALDFLYY